MRNAVLTGGVLVMTGCIVVWTFVPVTGLTALWLKLGILGGAFVSLGAIGLRVPPGDRHIKP